MTGSRKMLKYVSGFILILLIIVAFVLISRYAEDRKIFNQAENQAVQFMRLKNYDNKITPCATMYNPLTRTYYMYFDGENGNKATWSIDMTSRDNRGVFTRVNVDW